MLGDEHVDIFSAELHDELLKVEVRDLFVSSSG